MRRHFGFDRLAFDRKRGYLVYPAPRDLAVARAIADVGHELGGRVAACLVDRDPHVALDYFAAAIAMRPVVLANAA